MLTRIVLKWNYSLSVSFANIYERMDAYGRKTEERQCMKQRTILCAAVVLIVAVYFVSVYCVQPANGCYGPCVTANIDRTQVNVNQTVTVSGQICPPGANKTVRVVFTRPDFSYIEQKVTANPTTGNFTVTQKLDVAGYWNIFAINGVLADRLFAQVTDPANPNPTAPPSVIPLKYHPNFIVIGSALALLGRGRRSRLRH